MTATDDRTSIDALAAQVETGLQRCVDRGEVLGLTWLVSTGGETRSGAIGHLDAERSRPVGTDSIFRISSMTKPITAAAALLLVEDGVLSLEDPVAEWLPEFVDPQVLSHPAAAIDDTVPAERVITLDDLLTFRLGHGMDFADWSPKPVDDALVALGLGSGPPRPSSAPPPDEWLRRLSSVPLVHQPGSRWLYHTGADVLGVLVARVADQPFEEFLAERIFGPLAMVDTGFFVPAADLDRFGACFGADESGARAVIDPIDGQWSSPPAFPGGGAGLVSTVEDYRRFADALLAAGVPGTGPLLSAATVRTMTTNQLTEAQIAGGPEPDGSGGWGHGVGVQLTDDGPMSVGAYGWDGGLGSVWRTDPTRDLVAILLTNQSWTSPVPPVVCEAFFAALET